MSIACDYMVVVNYVVAVDNNSGDITILCVDVDIVMVLICVYRVCACVC